jgi:hypothetical protein
MGDTPSERSWNDVLLASGKADALSGRYIDVDDDLNALLQQADVIERDDLYTCAAHLMQLSDHRQYRVDSDSARQASSTKASRIILI